MKSVKSINPIKSVIQMIADKSESRINKIKGLHKLEKIVYFKIESVKSINQIESVIQTIK